MILLPVTGHDIIHFYNEYYVPFINSVDHNFSDLKLRITKNGHTFKVEVFLVGKYRKLFFRRTHLTLLGQVSIAKNNELNSYCQSIEVSSHKDETYSAFENMKKHLSLISGEKF